MLYALRGCQGRYSFLFDVYSQTKMNILPAVHNWHVKSYLALWLKWNFPKINVVVHGYMKPSLYLRLKM